MRNAVFILLGLLLCASSLFGKDYRRAPENFSTPQLRLYFYACEGSVEGVEQALKEGAEVDQLSDRHYNALHYAIRLNRIEVVQTLLSSGADMNARVGLKETRTEAKGVTPLALSAILGRTEIGLILLEHGADPEATREHGNGWDINAVSCAIKYNRNELVDAFVKQGIDISKPIKLWGSEYDGVPVLAIAAEHGSTDQVKRLVEDYHVSANSSAPYLEWNPLHVAVLYGNYEVAKYLIGRGADVNKLVEWSRHRPGKWSCLALAATEGRLELTQLLLANGAKPIKTRSRDNDPVFLADALGYDKILELYESRGYRSNYWGRLDADRAKGRAVADRRVENISVGSLFSTEKLAGDWPAASDEELLPQENFKLAIISDDQAEDLATLLTVEWSQYDGMDLLERDQIDALLKEHRFSRSGLLGGESLDSFARMSGARILVTVKTYNLGKNLVHELRLIDARHGVLLDVRYCPAQSKNVEALGKRYTANAFEQLSRLNSSREGPRAISVINVRSDFGSLEGVQLERQAHRLLEYELSRQSGVVVMQRQDLLDLKRENELSGEGENTLLGSSGFIDARLDLNESHDQIVGLKLRLQATGGESRSIEAPVVDGNLAPVLRTALVELLSHGSGSVEVEKSNNAGLDGRELLKESRWLSKVGLKEEALAYVRNATALGQNNRAIWAHYLNCLEAAYPEGDGQHFSDRATFENLFAYEQERLFALNNLYSALRQTNQKLQNWGRDAHFGFDKSICRLDAVSIRRRYGDHIALLEQDYFNLLRRQVFPMFLDNKEPDRDPEQYQELLCGALRVLRSVRCTHEDEIEHVMKELVSAFWKQFERVEFYAHPRLRLRSYGGYSLRNTPLGWTRCERILEWASEAGSPYIARELLAGMLSLGDVYTRRQHSIQKVESIERQSNLMSERVRDDCFFYWGSLPPFWRDAWKTNTVLIGGDARWISPLRAASGYFEAQVLPFLLDEDDELWQEPISGITSQFIWFDPNQLDYVNSILLTNREKIGPRGEEFFRAFQKVIQSNAGDSGNVEGSPYVFAQMPLKYWHPEAYGYQDFELLSLPVYHNGAWILLARHGKKAGGEYQYALFRIDPVTFETSTQRFESKYLLRGRLSKQTVVMDGSWLYSAYNQHGPIFCLNLESLELKVVPGYRKEQHLPVGCVAGGKFYTIAATVQDVEAHHYSKWSYQFIEYDPETDELNVLANMRRQPPENALDTSDLRKTREIKLSRDGAAILFRFFKGPDYIYDLAERSVSRHSDNRKGSPVFYQEEKFMELGLWEPNGQKWWLRGPSQIQSIKHYSDDFASLFISKTISMREGFKVVKILPEYSGSACEAYLQRDQAIEAGDAVLFDDLNYNTEYGFLVSSHGRDRILGFFKTEDIAKALKESSTIKIWAD